MDKERKIKETCIKFHAFDEFPMSELRKIDDAMLKLGYNANLIDNGNIVYIKVIEEEVSNK